MRIKTLVTRYFDLLLRCKKTSLLILDFVTKKIELCIREMRLEEKFDKGGTFSGLLSISFSSPLFSFACSRLRRPREWPRIMTLLRGHSQLTAIKTLVIAADELYNYHVALRCVVLRLTILHSAALSPILS